MRNARKKAEPQTGFTLLEVLVALAVIAVAMSAIIRTTAVITGNTARLKEKTYAHWVAMNRLSELRATRAWPSAGNTNDDVGMFGQNWRWTQKIIPLEITKHVRQVEISVTRAGGDEDRPLTTVTGFLLDPALVSQQLAPQFSVPSPPTNDDNSNDPGEDDGSKGAES